MRRQHYALLAALLLPVMTSTALAAEEKKPAPAKKQVQTKQQEEVIYGRQLMTPKEMTDYRAKMRAAKTAEERDKLRKEHHAAMQARAKARGVTLPDEPPAGRGPGAGPGKGPGEGPGKRVGPGGGGPGPRY